MPENQVVTLGIQTGVNYEGGPMDGQPMNPHVDMPATDNSYEGIDLGQLRWWHEGEGIHVVWHITDTTFADFPYWLIDIAPAQANSDMDAITIAAFRQQWDGTQSTMVVRYLTHDESTGQTRMYQRTAAYNMGLGEGDISYRFIDYIEDASAINYYGLSPTEAPEAIYRRYTFNLTTSESSYEISLEGPGADSWTVLSTNDAVLRTIWKQNETAGSDWTPGDVVYQADLQADLDCSVVGETNCTISVLTPYAVYPAPTDVFGKTFYAEKQWPIRYLQAAMAPARIKVEPLDEWPYLRTWLESDDNDQYDYDKGEPLLPGDVYDVYFYTASGELVDATMPMLYRAGEAPPETVVLDATAAEAVQYVSNSLENLMTGFVADIVIPHEISLPDEDTFLTYFEGDVPADTDTATATETDDTETDLLTPDSESETAIDSAVVPDSDSTSATP